MSTLATQIEYYIKRLLALERGRVRIQRNKIALYFDCAPSQINYVIQTRFSPEKGYLVESQRGGGGYVEIVAIKQSNQRELFQSMYEILAGGISQQQGMDLIYRLEKEEIITTREKQILESIIRRETLPVSLPERDYLRARILQAALQGICRAKEKEG